MAKYLTDVDRWLSHECRLVKAGTEFETEFPKGPEGKPMRLSDSLREIKPAKASSKAEVKSESTDDGGLV